MIKFVGSFETVSQLPQTQFSEYAFIGRSNVGKSSLINAVAGQVIARTSKTPGRTQSLNLFNFDDRVMIVDLPGYGYATTSKVNMEAWLRRLEEYLITRRQLSRLFILIDSRLGVKPSDLDLMEFCDGNGISYQVILTKKDKRSKEKEKKTVCSSDHPAMIEEILETSSEKKIGIESLREIIGIK
ncbi:MAG: YihA family ribosome biogenesis GTP-binding protein [Alphaproteobacteria bacterium]|nr:YihA family ribosome biogenesis GTP-binding protein [Alphaproteobacteria bacterium]MBN2675612.1 YihA family ribosome biogenesis GTP-binding protein [Alphaproteobacteria bacterium]